MQTDTKGKGKAEEGSGKGEELADSIGSLSIGPGRANFKKKPVIIIVIGMAGALISLARCLITFSSMNLPTNLGANSFVLSPCSGTGKTTLMHRLVCDTQASNRRSYVVNLDPAVMTLPFGANIDIRDTVRYKDVMKEYGLGPNGGILTSLNLFATKFDEVDCYNLFYHSTAHSCRFDSFSQYCWPVSLFISSIYYLSGSKFTSSRGVNLYPSRLLVCLLFSTCACLSLFD